MNIFDVNGKNFQWILLRFDGRFANKNENVWQKRKKFSVVNKDEKNIIKYSRQF